MASRRARGLRARALARTPGLRLVRLRNTCSTRPASGGIPESGDAIGGGDGSAYVGARRARAPGRHPRRGQARRGLERRQCGLPIGRRRRRAQGRGAGAKALRDVGPRRLCVLHALGDPVRDRRGAAPRPGRRVHFRRRERRTRSPSGWPGVAASGMPRSSSATCTSSSCRLRASWYPTRTLVGVIVPLFALALMQPYLRGARMWTTLILAWTAVTLCAVLGETWPSQRMIPEPGSSRRAHHRGRRRRESRHDDAARSLRRAAARAARKARSRERQARLLLPSRVWILAAADSRLCTAAQRELAERKRAESGWARPRSSSGRRRRWRRSAGSRAASRTTSTTCCR